MKKPIKSARLIPMAIALGTILFTCLVIQRLPLLDVLIERLEYITYDWRVRGAARTDQPLATNLAGVFIDDIALRHLNDPKVMNFAYRWPWPRFIYGILVREMAAQGAEGIAFDILMQDSDSGVRVTEDGLVPKPNDPPEQVMIPSDEFFAREMRRASNVILAVSAGEGGQATYPTPLFLTNSWSVGNTLSEPNYGVLRRVRPFVDHPRREWHHSVQFMSRALSFDIEAPIVEEGGISFRSFGDTENPIYSLPLKADGSLNLEELGEEEGPEPTMPFIDKTTRIWHLGIVLASRTLGLDLDRAQIEKDRIVLNGPDGLTREIPLDAKGSFYINWRIRLEDYPEINAAPIRGLLIVDSGRQSGDTDLGSVGSALKDKLVIVGSVGTGNNIIDQGATPLEDDAMLVMKHFNVANSVLTGLFIKPFSQGDQLFYIALCGVLSAFSTWRLRVSTAALVVATLLGAYIFLCYWLYLKWLLWLPIALPVLGATMTHGTLVTYRVVFEQRQQRHVKSVFSKLVSPNVVHELLRADSLNLAGRRRRMTVFFADVRGFTTMTDINQAKAEQVVNEGGLSGAEREEVYDRHAAETLETVNLFLATIADTIKKHDGTLDKYMGDCVMAFWGAPTPNERHALACVRAAIDAQRAMEDLNKKRAQEGKTQLALGTGINTGMMTVGLMGSAAHILNYTVFGREVNIASRLEGVSGRGRIIIGAATFKDLQRDDDPLAASCVEQDPVLVKGIKDPVSNYEVPWRKPQTGGRETDPSREA